MNFRCLIEATVNVVADSEEQAAELAVKSVRPENVICWSTDP